MEKKVEEISEFLSESRSIEDIVISDDAELAPFRALSEALERRIRVSTSQIRVHKNDPSSAEFVAIEGIVDEKTLACLEESVSDVISGPSHERHGVSNSPSNFFQGQSVLDKISSHSSGSFEGKTFLDKNISPSRSSEGQSLIDEKISGHSRSSQGHPSQTTSSNVLSTKTHDSFYSIPSCTSSFDGIVTPEALKIAEEAIADLEKNGPAGLVHLSSLSDAIGKPLRIWSSGNAESRKVGRTRTGEAVDIEYHEAGPGETQGHWTLRGNIDPDDNLQGQLNDCLFCVVADQIGRMAPELRTETTERMRKNIKSLANRIVSIAIKENSDRISLLVGGARYNGQRPQDAGRVIDNSQQSQCHPSGLYGHPRGHASHPGATGPTESAENYSMTGQKSAFLSREDQDAVGHLALETRSAQEAMARLNRGEQSIAVRVSPGQLEPGPLPMGIEFYGGERRGAERPIRELLLVLRHHSGEQNNPEADVFVHTFYPILG